MNSQSMITLFHGSPHNIEDKIKPSAPRGNDDFQKLKAVFATDLEKSAQIYAIVRDKKRERKGKYLIAQTDKRGIYFTRREIQFLILLIKEETFVYFIGSE